MRRVATGVAVAALLASAVTPQAAGGQPQRDVRQSAAAWSTDRAYELCRPLGIDLSARGDDDYGAMGRRIPGANSAPMAAILSSSCSGRAPTWRRN